VRVTGCKPASPETVENHLGVSPSNHRRWEYGAPAGSVIGHRDGQPSAG